MKKSIAQRLAILFALVGCSTVAVAESPATLPDAKAMQEVQARFQSLDKNRDLRISKAEAGTEKALADRFAAVDANGDGFLSAPEFEARPSAEPFE